jgi:hypothetical protein
MSDSVFKAVVSRANADMIAKTLGRPVDDEFHISEPLPITLNAATFELRQLAEEVWTMEKRLGQIHQKLRTDGHALSTSSAYNAGVALYALGQQLDEDRLGKPPTPRGLG